MRHWRNFTGKEVVVVASGVTYRGVLVEMTDTSILLRSTAGHREVQMEAVTSVELAAGGSGPAISSPSPLSGIGR